MAEAKAAAHPDLPGRLIKTTVDQVRFLPGWHIVGDWDDFAEQPATADEATPTKKAARGQTRKES
jgi:hypothetical protein